MEVHALLHVPLRNHVFAFQQAGLAHPGLRGEVHEVRALEARHVLAGELQQRLHAAPALELGRSEVRHLEAVEAGHVRAVTPDDARQRGLQPPMLPTATYQAPGPQIDLGETLGLLELESLRLLRVHASHARDRGDDVGAFGEGRTGAGGHVEIAGGIDDDAAANGLRAFLGLDNHAGRAAVLDDRRTGTSCAA